MRRKDHMGEDIQSKNNIGINISMIFILHFLII